MAMYDEFYMDITEADTQHVTLANGTANIWSAVITITPKEREYFIFEAGKTALYMYLADSTPTELDDSTPVRIVVEDPSGTKRKIITTSQYKRFKELQDIDKKYYFPTTIILRPYSKLKIEIKASKAASSEQTKLVVSEVHYVTY